MTHTPASGPVRLVTMPARSSSSTASVCAVSCRALSATPTARTAVTPKIFAKAATPDLLTVRPPPWARASLSELPLVDIPAHIRLRRDQHGTAQRRDERPRLGAEEQ